MDVRDDLFLLLTHDLGLYSYRFYLLRDHDNDGMVFTSKAFTVTSLMELQDVHGLFPSCLFHF